MRVDCPECSRTLDVADDSVRVTCECGAAFTVEGHDVPGAFRGGVLLDLREEHTGPPALVTDRKKYDARVITVRDTVPYTPFRTVATVIVSGIAIALLVAQRGLAAVFFGLLAVGALVFVGKELGGRRERLIVAKGRLRFIGHGEQGQTLAVEQIESITPAQTGSVHWTVTIRAGEQELVVGDMLQLDERTARWVARRLRRLLGAA